MTATRLEDDVSRKCDTLTMRMCLEVLYHEALVLRPYRDVGGVWTWGAGLTAASGVDPLAWQARSATVEDCLVAYVACLRRRYFPEVLAVMGPGPEHHLAAGLSFHWNTGAIARASWPAALPDAQRAAGAMLDWCKPACILGRRRAESRLLAEGRWAHGPRVKVFEGLTPEDTPDPETVIEVDVRPFLTRILAR